MKVFFILAAVVTYVSAQFACPEADGLFEDSRQCDKYYECKDGEATEKLCPDGLVFDIYIRNPSSVKRCDHPFNVDCGERNILQEPQPSGYCPRLNGLFAHPEPTVCDAYYNCIDGEATELVCSDGLHFDQSTGACIWAQQLGRQNCVRTILKTEDGFQCPNEQVFDSEGLLISHPKYAHPTDCQRFYVCMNGIEPRYLGCPFGMVYNEETQICDLPKNVPACADWYKNIEEPAPELPVEELI